MRLRRTILSATLAILVLVTVNQSASATVTQPVECIAHRGNPTTHTEETFATYASILATNPDGVDGDVRWTSTGFPYLLHNSYMGVFGRPDVNLSAITGTTAASYVSPSGDTIESLYSLMTQLQAYPGVKLEIELKTVPTTAEWTELATRLDPIRDRTTVTSFNLTTVRTAQDNGYRTAWLTEAPTTSTATPTVDEDYASVTGSEVTELASVGVNVEGWHSDPTNPDTPTDWNALSALGVRTFNTDNETGCMSWRQQADL